MTTCASTGRIGDDVGDSRPEPASGGGTIGRGDASRVGLASAVAAASSALVVAGAPRLIGVVEDTTVFLTFWSALFACFGLLTGIQIETTRAVTATTTGAPQTAPGLARRPRAAVVGGACGLGVAAVVGAAAPWWGARVLDSEGTPLALLVALGVAGFAVHSVLVGALAGTARWRLYSGLIASESLTRLVLVAAAALLGGTLLGPAAGAALAAFAWAAFLLSSPGVRAAARERADAALRPYLGRLGAASLATGASALLVVGFPTLLSLTTPGPEYRAAAPLLLAITLTRAPLMIPLNAYQGVAVAHVVRHREQGPRALLPAARAVLIVGALGSVAAWALGPWLLQLVGGSTAYHLDGLRLGALTIAATGLALVSLTGAVCQALNHHGAFVAGWWIAVAVAVAILLLPLPLVDRAPLALTAAPVAGVVVHLAALRRARDSAAVTDSASPPSAPEPLA